MRSQCSASTRLTLVTDFGIVVSRLTSSFDVVMEEIRMTLIGVHEAVRRRRARMVGILLTLFDYAKTAVEGLFGFVDFADFVDFPASRGSHLQAERSPYWVGRRKHQVVAALHVHYSQRLTGLKLGSLNWKQNSMI